MLLRGSKGKHFSYFHSSCQLGLKLKFFWDGHENIYVSAVVYRPPAPEQGNWAYDNLKPKVRITFSFFLSILLYVFTPKRKRHTQKKLGNFAKLQLNKLWSFLKHQFCQIAKDQMFFLYDCKCYYSRIEVLKKKSAFCESFSHERNQNLLENWDV